MSNKESLYLPICKQIYTSTCWNKDLASTTNQTKRVTDNSEQHRLTGMTTHQKLAKALQKADLKT